ncbi:MAG: helix-hairpin-helix domain-containing protein [Gorillibacterium sp.]|nr:helix-hairpin-helix domain-containing protein [Gorillibacterium sp.]
MWMFFLQYRSRVLAIGLTVLVGIGAYVWGRSSVQTEAAVGTYKLNEQVAMMLGEESVTPSTKSAKAELVGTTGTTNNGEDQSATLVEGTSQAPATPAAGKESKEQLPTAVSSTVTKEQLSVPVSNNAQNTSGSAAAADKGAGLIDLNTASLAQLMELPRIGETKAAAIITYREQHGGFASPDEIVNVKGIGEKTYESFKDKVTATR